EGSRDHQRALRRGKAPLPGARGPRVAGHALKPPSRGSSSSPPRRARAEALLAVLALKNCRPREGGGPVSICGNGVPAFAGTTIDALLAGELAAQDFVDLRGIGLALGGLHRLADEGVEGLLLAGAIVLHLLRVRGEHLVDHLLQR